MTASVVSWTAQAVTTGQPNITVTKPTGVVTGSDLWAFCWANNVTADWTPPSGSWTTQYANTSIGMEAFRYTAGGSEPADYTFSRSASSSNAGVILINLTGGGTLADIDAVFGASSTSLVLPSVDPTGANTLLLEVITGLTSTVANWAAPGSSTQRTAAGATASGVAVPFGIADETLGAGATGTRTWTRASAQASRGFILAVNPQAPATGTASGTWAFTGAATGDTPPNDGTVSGAWVFAGAASGSAPRTGTAAGSFQWAGAAVGDSPSTGSAAGSWEFTGTATGITVRRGSSVGSWGFAGTATGGTIPAGVVTGSVSWVGSVLGSEPTGGAVAGAWSFVGAATGVAPPGEGVAQGTWVFTGTATGSSSVRDITISGRLLPRTRTASAHPRAWTARIEAP